MKTYYKTKSSTIFPVRYWRKFNSCTFQNRSKIFMLVKNVEAHGTCEDHWATGSFLWRFPITIQTPNNVTRVQESVSQSPFRFLRRRSQKIGISVSSVRHILIKDLILYPSQIQIKHHTNWPRLIWKKGFPYATVFRKRSTMTRNSWMISCFRMKPTSSWMILIIPRTGCFGVVRSLRVAWVTTSKHGIIGSFFFKDDQSNAVIVTKENSRSVRA